MKGRLRKRGRVSGRGRVVVGVEVEARRRVVGSIAEDSLIEYERQEYRRVRELPDQAHGGTL